MAENIIRRLKKYYKANASMSGIHVYNAYTMSDVYNILDDIGQNIFGIKKDTIGRPLWFRGQESEAYMLLPSLYRNRENKKNSKRSYSTLSLAEEYRHQNFSARVNHLIKTNPKNRVEWQELLQHHFGKTRFMDWSESLEKALNFALEPFIDTKDTWDNRNRRATNTPGIWVLNPYGLNEHIYDFFADAKNSEYVVDALKNLFPKSDLVTKGQEIQSELGAMKDVYFNFGDKKLDIAVNGIVSVCILDEYYHYNAENMVHMLERNEFNPFFYLIVRYYADALPVNAEINTELLPPIASVQPYHSERIRAQRGTFTIFPNYCRSEAAAQLAGTNMDVISIESQKKIADCFCNIRLCDPVRIAKELIYAGERRPEVYPDVQIYADYLETERFFL